MPCPVCPPLLLQFSGPELEVCLSTRQCLHVRQLLEGMFIDSLISSHVWPEALLSHRSLSYFLGVWESLPGLSKIIFAWSGMMYLFIKNCE